MSEIKIALAGNPNSGKTTLFNALTGANQFVGNWPGVTVEKKEGKLRKYEGVTITDLPGIYSLSPYTLEEVVARNYILDEKPDAILNIVDGTNLERNLYLTTQLIEVGVPVVIAINMMDVVRKNGDKINTEELGRELGCKVVEISALKGTGIEEAAKAAVDAAKEGRRIPYHTFSGPVEHALAHIEEAVVNDLPESRQRWYAIKVFERDDKVLEKLKVPKDVREHVEKDIKAAEEELDDDAESIITNERYLYIADVIKGCYKKKNKGQLSTSDKIDKVVTNRWAALPIFVVIMFLVYYISISTVGGLATDFTNDQFFGDGYYLFGIGRAAYTEEMTDYYKANIWTDSMVKTVDAAAKAGVTGADKLKTAIDDEDYSAFDEAYGTYASKLDEEGYSLGDTYDKALASDNCPDPSDTSERGGIWIPGVPVLFEKLFDATHMTNAFIKSLVIKGIVGGVGAVLGFVPQMFVLFFLLAFLEACGYMSRVAFVLDKIFRRFGLSGKSFIPMLIATGCGVPGVMASRTIENERDRRMTIMTTTFMPCGAKLPIIALVTAALFNNKWYIAPSCYFIGIASIIISGIMLKKTKWFAGDPAPFVMELPAYHWPTLGNLLRSMWERGWSFIKKAGTIILLSTIVVWIGTTFGVRENGTFGWDAAFADSGLETTVLGYIGNVVKWIFYPLGFDNIRATIATVMGLVAKENVVGVFGILDFEGMTALQGFSFMIFNLLCAPCFAAIGAIKREMNSRKWTWRAIGYECGYAYALSLMVYQFGSVFSGRETGVQWIFFVCAVAVLLAFIYMLFVKKYIPSNTLTEKVKV